ARLPGAPGHAGIEPRPAAYHRLDAVRADHHANAHRLVAQGTAQPHLPATIGEPVHARGFRADQDFHTVGRSTLGQERVESRTIENPSHVALGHFDFAV